MADSISWVDSTGPALLSNNKPTPATRLGNWTPDIEPVGHSAVRLGSGITDFFEFRQDDLVSFEIAAIPGTAANLRLCKRLKKHLLTGGVVTLNTSRPIADDFLVYCLAEGSKPQIDFSDRQMLEYTFSVSLKGLFDADGGGGGGDGSLTPPEIFGTALKLWWDPTQETGYSDGEDLVEVSDYSGNGNVGTAGNANAGLYAAYGDGEWWENQQNNLPMFKFIHDTNTIHILRQWLLSPPILIPSDGALLMVVGKRHGLHREYNILARFDNDDDASTVNIMNIVETKDAEGAGTENEIKWMQTEASGIKVYDGSLTTTAAVYAVKINSASEAFLYVDGVVDPDGAFDPADEVNDLSGVAVGEGEWVVGDVILVQGDPTPTQIAAANAYFTTKWAI